MSLYEYSKNCCLLCMSFICQVLKANMLTCYEFYIYLSLTAQTSLIPMLQHPHHFNGNLTSVYIPGTLIPSPC